MRLKSIYMLDFLSKLFYVLKGAEVGIVNWKAKKNISWWWKMELNNSNNKRICICNCYSSQGNFPLRHLLNVQTFYRFCHQRSKFLVPMCCHSFCFWIGSNELLVVFPWDTQESRTNMLEKLFSYPLLSFFLLVWSLVTTWWKTCLYQRSMIFH